MYSTVKPPSFYNVGIYIRLSQEDEDKAHKRESESESVLNQRSLLMNFLRDNGFVLTDEYVDDGYSGTNFDRPAFKRLLEDIEKGKINPSYLILKALAKVLPLSLDTLINPNVSPEDEGANQMKMLYCSCPSEMRETLLHHTQETAKELTELSEKFETN